MTKKIALLLVSLLVSSAWAEDSPFYVYGGVGIAKSDRKNQADASLRGAGITAFTSSADETDTAAKLQLGWQINRNFAVEAGYVDFGKFRYQASATVPAATRDGNVKTDAWTLGALASLPVNEQFSLFAKAGVAAYTLKFHCAGTGIACVAPDRKEHGTPLFYGVGMAWNFTPRWFMRAEYEVFQDIGSSFNVDGTTGTSRSDIRLGTIGVGYRF